ncbi:MAG: AI-2E family transporter [Vicinamibacterales bacterium]
MTSSEPHRSPFRENRFQRAFLLLLVVSMSAAFLFMIRDFLQVILLAAVFAGVCHPIYRRFQGLLRGRSAASALLTILLLVLVVVGPLVTLGGLLVQQALLVAEIIGPRLQSLVKGPTQFDRVFEYIPMHERLLPYRDQIIQKTGEVVGALGTGLVASITGTIGGTVIVLVQVVIFLYTLFFLLIDGRKMLDTALAYVPLSEQNKEVMIEKFVSVSRATLKGTVLIGLLQGTLSGLAFWVAGIQGAVFWGALMTALSIIPGVGGALVWVPAALTLMLSGHVLAGVLLAGFCALVVGSVDNLLRPRLVGRDTSLHELFIFFSTIGGLILFGPMGFVLGPVLAALFVTVWEIYGRTFKDDLQEGPASMP